MNDLDILKKIVKQLRITISNKFYKINEKNKIIELDLSINQQLVQLLPEFAQLQNVQVLYLSNNQLAQLPPVFAQLQNLQELDLRNNCI